MPTEEAWQQWLERLYNLRRDKSGSHERPHKPVLLLSILDLLDRGLLTENSIPLSPDLVKTFNRYFEAVHHKDDKPTIDNPFYFLSGDGFWTLQNPSRGPLYEPGNAASPPSMSVLRSSPGRFDPHLWELMLNAPLEPNSGKLSSPATSPSIAPSSTTSRAQLSPPEPFS